MYRIKLPEELASASKVVEVNDHLSQLLRAPSTRVYFYVVCRNLSSVCLLVKFQVGTFLLNSENNPQIVNKLGRL